MADFRRPLFMWAGGKTKMISQHYLPFIPNQIDHYYEPFFGAGAFLVHLWKTGASLKSIHINDINDGIISIYKTIKDDLDNFLNVLDSLDSRFIPLSKSDRKTMYYDVRNRHAFNFTSMSQTEEAATLYFLLKTSFNGIYQINNNTNNRFGTPSGLLNQKDSVYNKDTVIWWHEKLNEAEHCEITSMSWNQLDVPPKRNNTFIFLDPPYRDSFTSYGQSFSDDDQKELLDWFTNVIPNQTMGFLCNRDSNDTFFDLYDEDEEQQHRLHRFPVTYTAGRRKKQQDGSFEAKPAIELLLTKNIFEKKEKNDNRLNPFFC